MIKAITFDVWSTLIEPVDYRDQRIAYLCAMLETRGFRIEREDVTEAYSFSLSRFSDIWHNEQRHMPSRERIKILLRQLAVELPENALTEVVDYFETVVLNDPPPLVQDAETVLYTLNDAYKIGLICDSGMSPGRVMREVFARYDLLQLFDVTVFSDEVGRTKPHLLMYQTALNSMHVPAQRAVHVGDLLYTDVIGAKSAGMKAIWFNRDREQVGERSIAPDYEITRLSEVLDIV